MSFRNKIILINTVVFLIFVGSFIYISINLVKNNYDSQLDSIKSGIIGQNTKLVETFVKSQDALLEDQSNFITEEIKYLTLVFESSCMEGYPELNSIESNLSCINSVATDYIKNISVVDMNNNIEVSLTGDQSSLIAEYIAEHTRLWNSEKALKFKIVENENVVNFYVLQPIEKHPNHFIKFELDLDIFSKSLSFDSLDAYNYRFLLVDDKGYVVTSNVDKKILNLLSSSNFEGGNDSTLKNYILNQSSGFFSIDSGDGMYNVIHRKNKAMNWQIILVTPESHLHSSYVSTRDLLLSSDNLLVEKIVLVASFLFFLFLFLIYITVSKTFKPVKKLINQADYLKSRDFKNAMKVLCHNGDEIELLSRAYSEAGGTIKLLIEDLEEKVRIRTEQYELAAQEALIATKNKSTLLSNVSHEIRTPLNAIIGYTHILRKEKFISKYEHELEGITTASIMILDIVNDLLDFERLDSVNYTLNKKKVDLGIILRDIERTFIPLAHQKDLEFDVCLNGIDNENQLFIDHLRFQQALANIISNAIKFTDIGRILLEVRLDMVDGKEMVVFSVSDTGRGIKKEYIKSIFNSFEQLNQEDKQFGFGLGLAITKALIGLMEGELIVESEFGKGSVFRVCLPIEIMTPSNINSEKASTPRDIDISPPTHDLIGLKALVVDDVEFNREILQYHLSEQGVECICAIDGFDALAALTLTSFDVILTDVSMPNMGGIELANRVKADYPGVPIIAVTARATIQDEEKMSHHFNSYITKPIDQSELIRTLLLTLES
ncbi:ATP-binding protein [Vibrio jasicida]|uniref:ATP-binding protein n=1 Tax=Vibrio jasicida TaxID=766224 RepID=UPI0005762CD3|nr:ATP-binding protein [Vibrio jasicida]